ncbi:hypothetical protein AGABI2DRAFT_65105 [Agaricus bisporus var. bisporus H97]|uniref:hypothetical protein n=1 Tax=Agaricus bisporus var. bisporus (strain H97 / ATCC MYA-4626 / FGSC 10389) TaxID=936046 RepID=UPI00029F5446|nr:hypothetical protein AGABI2DRAFT_65105 [Agaricus bisporus var. bisporus H97]EKV50593.1 hypothetical protein AGABI2DRAFT_65105 [Agaricus bisporus var. bisporus H97]
MPPRRLRIAFLHPDLGIGGAERFVVDAALGLRKLGHIVDIYTSHWDPNHCFEETKDGILKVRYVKPPFPRSIKGKFHILCAHARQMHLVTHLLSANAQSYDVYFVDQLSTCVPFLRVIGSTRVVFYCHFPDKLLANGAFVDGTLLKKQGSLLKRIYRYPMDWLEEVTTRQADVILANSKFTARVFNSYFPSISQNPDIVYPGINIQAYTSNVDTSNTDVATILSEAPTLLSLNRFEKKKNAALAIEAFVIMKAREPTQALRLVLAGEQFEIYNVLCGMICGVPVLACDSGGPTESIIDTPSDDRTGWLRPPDPVVWADTLQEILALSPGAREAISSRGRERAREFFSLDAMSKGLEVALFKVVALGSVQNLIFKVFVMLIGLLAAYVFTSKITSFLIPSRFQ